MRVILLTCCAHCVLLACFVACCRYVAPCVVCLDVFVLRPAAVLSWLFDVIVSVMCGEMMIDGWQNKQKMVV